MAESGFPRGRFSIILPATLDAAASHSDLFAGTKILLALNNVDVPWYVRQQVDIHPESDWRKHRASLDWYDPLAKPVISMENTLGSHVIDPTTIHFLNLTHLDVLNFGDYVKVEPEGLIPCASRPLALCLSHLLSLYSQRCIDQRIFWHDPHRVSSA